MKLETINDYQLMAMAIELMEKSTLKLDAKLRLAFLLATDDKITKEEREAHIKILEESVKTKS